MRSPVADVRGTCGRPAERPCPCRRHQHAAERQRRGWPGSCRSLWIPNRRHQWARGSPVIYRGVVRDVESPGCLLVMDIGGAVWNSSLERHQSRPFRQLVHGCVSWTHRYFPDGIVTKLMDDAILAPGVNCSLWCGPTSSRDGRKQWVPRAPLWPLSASCRPKGMPKSTKGLAWLRRQLHKAGDLDDLELEAFRTTAVQSSQAVLPFCRPCSKAFGSRLRATGNALPGKCYWN